MGIIFALVAFLGWGFGDFLIEKSTRKLGDMVSLFFIALIGVIGLLPFISSDLASILRDPQNYLYLLLLTSAVMLFASLFNFEALRVGKISIVEPINAFEVLVAAMLSAALIRELPSALELVLILIIICGIFFYCLCVPCITSVACIWKRE